MQRERTEGFNTLLKVSTLQEPMGGDLS